ARHLEPAVDGLLGERRSDPLVTRPVAAGDVDPGQVAADPFHQLNCRGVAVHPDQLGDDATKIGSAAR
ncbi:hypothetical protein U6M47_13055, partial [Cutibacterium acnes]